MTATAGDLATDGRLVIREPRVATMTEVGASDKVRRQMRPPSSALENEFLFTSESVTEGHPDKICDQVSDGVLDAVMRDDPQGRVACECLVNTGLVVVAGEISTQTYVDIPKIVRETLHRIGYDRAKYGFDADTCAVITAIDEQSSDIAQGVDTAYEARTDPNDEDELDRAGAGDQGMMFGYATRETRALMPMPIQVAHTLAHRLAEVRKADVVPYLRPDGKTQVTVRYENDRPVEIYKLLISTQHKDRHRRRDADQERPLGARRRAGAARGVQGAVHREGALRGASSSTRPGKFEVGGPMGDAGLTGRKIIVDTYGGAARHGGGAFSGKDPSKVDRSAAYAARYVGEERGRRRPRGPLRGAGRLRDRGRAPGLADGRDLRHREAPGQPDLEDRRRGLRPASRRPSARDLDLHRPIYQKTAAYGHFGRTDHDFTLGADRPRRGAPSAAGLEAGEAERAVEAAEL